MLLCISILQVKAFLHLPKTLTKIQQEKKSMQRNIK